MGNFDEEDFWDWVEVEFEISEPRKMEMMREFEELLEDGEDFDSEYYCFIMYIHTIHKERMYSLVKEQMIELYKDF